MVPKARGVVMGSKGLGTESTSPQHIASISSIDSHKSDPFSTATLVTLSKEFLTVLFPPAPANCWEIIIIGGGAIQTNNEGLSSSGAEVDNVVVVVVATGLQSMGIRVGAGVS